MSPALQGREPPVVGSSIGSLPIRRAHISATASASPSRFCKAVALPSSSATATSRATTESPAPRSVRNGSSARKPGWPFSVASGLSKRRFTKRMISGYDRKLVEIGRTPSGACARNARAPGRRR